MLFTKLYVILYILPVRQLQNICSVLCSGAVLTKEKGPARGEYSAVESDILMSGNIQFELIIFLYRTIKFEQIA